jgi:hypothetical protein
MQHDPAQLKAAPPRARLQFAESGSYGAHTAL